jgi:hypothetical protein
MKWLHQNFTSPSYVVYALYLLILINAGGCKKYLEVPPPLSEIEAKEIFEDDRTCAAALNSIYARMNYYYLFEGITGVGFLTGLYGDEFKSWHSLHQAIYTNNINSGIEVITYPWTNMYEELYSVNAVVEGLTSARNLNYRDQWLGEAYFLRGLFYFYLTNLYGDVPLVVSTDYRRNNVLTRSPQEAVYKQIISDLQQARSLLSPQYKDGNGLVTTSRGRPNRSSATALLARVHLYNNDWSNARAMADSVIANSDYQLVNPEQTFLIGSKENIWGIVPFENSSYLVQDAFFIIPNGVTPQDAYKVATLSEFLVNSFEPNDLRFTNWVGVDSVPAAGGTPASVYYFPSKYKATGIYTAPQEIVVMLRLAEQYLIRSEARMQLGDAQGAEADLNIIRARAGLQPTAARSQAEMLAALERERRLEFFSEEGHRFFDLRRTGNLDSVMVQVSAQKGGSWSSFKAWWPIPPQDIIGNPNLTQTPGY